MENKIYEVTYNATFISKSWRVGTKADPNKEYGLIKFDVEVPLSKPDKAGNTSYVKSIEEFTFDKANFPEVHIDRYTPVKVVYQTPLEPQGKMRFVRLEK